MIYLATVDHHLVILEPDELEHIKNGGTLMSPNNRVALMYTPDAHFMGRMIAELQKAEVVTAGAIDVIHRQSLTREPVHAGAHRPHVELIQEPEPADASRSKQN